MVELLADLEVGRLELTAVALEVLLSEQETIKAASEEDQGRLQGDSYLDVKNDRARRYGGARGPHMAAVMRHPRGGVGPDLLR